MTRQNNTHSPMLIGRDGDEHTYCGRSIHSSNKPVLAASDSEVTCKVCQRFINRVGDVASGMAFTCFIQGEREYRHLVITIYSINDMLGVWSAGAEGVELQWQTDSETWKDDSRRSKWYAARTTIQTKSWEKQSILYNIAKKVLQPMGFNDNTSPADVVARLRDMGAVEMVYDSRQHCHVRIEELAPSSHARWMDDYSTMGTDHIQVSCVAATRQEAQDMLEQEARNSNYVKAEWLERWIEAGRPVVIDHTSKAPRQTQHAEQAVVDNPFGW